MNYEVAQSSQEPDAWVVEAINFDGDGEVYRAVFSGPKAEERAREYAEFKQSRVGPCGMPHHAADCECEGMGGAR